MMGRRNEIHTSTEGALNQHSKSSFGRSTIFFVTIGAAFVLGLPSIGLVLLLIFLALRLFQRPQADVPPKTAQNKSDEEFRTPASFSRVRRRKNLSRRQSFRGSGDDDVSVISSFSTNLPKGHDDDRSVVSCYTTLNSPRARSLRNAQGQQHQIQELHSKLGMSRAEQDGLQELLQAEQNKVMYLTEMLKRYQATELATEGSSQEVRK